MSKRLLSAAIGLIVALSGLAGGAQQAENPGPPPAPGTAQQPPDQQPPPDRAPGATPTFRAGVNLVRVDVIISDKNGNPVEDLKQSDFEVLEDGKAQAVQTFKLISVDDAALQAETKPREIVTDSDEEIEAARDEVRLFGIFLDDYHVSDVSSLVARQQIASFINTQLRPSDMVGVMYPLESVSSVRMTRNHDAISRGIQQFTGRKYDYRPRNSIEERYQHYPAETIEQIRNQVSLSAIKGLIIHMGTLKEGRKALILVSEGYTNMLPPQLRDPNASQPGINNPAAFDPQAGVNDPNENRAAFVANSNLDLDLREVYDTANKNNTAIYAVDPRGLAPFEFGMDKPTMAFQTDATYLRSTMETLRTLADLSDGRAIVNRNDIAIAMKQIVRDTSAYYLLGYNSNQAPSDGKFHEIKVRVKRPGVQVRARRGYWAMNREETAAATAPPKPAVPKPVENALAASASTQATRSRVVRTWIGTERAENGKTRVTFVWEPSPRPAGDTRPSEQPARVNLTAASADGNPYFRGRIPGANGATNGSAPAAGNATPASKVTFDVDPGKVQLRMSVEGAASEVLDSEVREIDVPNLGDGKTSIATPAFFRVRTVREMQQLKGDALAVPTAGREFSRSDRVLIRVAAYGPGTQAPKVTAKLLNRAGTPMSDLPVAPSDAASAATQIEMQLSALAPGEYVIEISADGEGGSAKELVGFRVTG